MNNWDVNEYNRKDTDARRCKRAENPELAKRATTQSKELAARLSCSTSL